MFIVAAPIPLTQTELRAVMKASQQTQEHLFTQHYETTPEQTQGYQHFTNARKGRSKFYRPVLRVFMKLRFGFNTLLKCYSL